MQYEIKCSFFSIPMMNLLSRAVASHEALRFPAPLSDRGIELCLLLINIHEKTWLLQLKTTTF